MSVKDCNLLCWNVRGLNDAAKRSSVRNQIVTSGATIVCLQETKVAVWTHSWIVETVGTDLAQDVITLPFVGTAGGILLAASERFFRLYNQHQTANTVSATILMLADNTEWSITGVYGPQSDNDKIQFMQELTDLKQVMHPAWLLLGDFNLIYRVQDKNNGRVNLALLNRFKATIDNLLLAPINLRGKRFTWCNDQQVPTMTKIDHLFASPEWLDIFPRTDLQALASLGSDHCALFLRCEEVMISTGALDLGVIGLAGRVFLTRFKKCGPDRLTLRMQSCGCMSSYSGLRRHSRCGGEHTLALGKSHGQSSTSYFPIWKGPKKSPGV